MSHSFIFRVSLNPAPITTTAGADFSLSVQVQAINQSTGLAIAPAFISYEWKRDDGDPLPLSATPNNNILSFTDCFLSDTGYYYCVVTLLDYTGNNEPGFPYQISSDEAYVLVTSTPVLAPPTDGVVGETGVNNGRAKTEVIPVKTGLEVSVYGAGKGLDGIVQRQYPITIESPVLIQVVLSGEIQTTEAAVFYANNNAFITNPANIDPTSRERFTVEGGKISNAGTTDPIPSAITITGLYDTGNSTARFSVSISGSFYAWVWRIDTDPYKPIFNRNNNVIETGWLTPGRHTLHVALWDEENTLLDYASQDFSIRAADVKDAEAVLPALYTPKALTDPSTPATTSMASQEGVQRRAGDISLRHLEETAPGQVALTVGLNWGHVTWAYQIDKDPIVQVPEGVTSVTVNLSDKPGTHQVTVVGIGPDGFEAGASRSANIRIHKQQDVKLLAVMQEADGAMTFYVDVSDAADQWMYRLDSTAGWSFVDAADNAVTLSVDAGSHKIQLAQLRNNHMLGGVTEHYFTRTPEALNGVKVFQMLGKKDKTFEVQVNLDPAIHYGWRWRLDGMPAITVRTGDACIIGPLEKGKHLFEVWGLGAHDKQVGPRESYPILV